MGARNHIAAEKLKEARKNLYFAKLVGVPSSPLQMRYRGYRRGYNRRGR